MASARVRAKTLSVARSILRHLRKEIDNVTGFPPAPSVAPWTSAVLDSYRSNAGADKAAARGARAQATEFLDYLAAIKEQRALIQQYGAVDIDTAQYREAAAKRVGLTIPDRVPLQAQDVASKYDLASKLSQLKGVAGLKAQLYGLDAVMKPGVAAGTKDAHPAGSVPPAAGSGSFDDLLK